MYTPARLSQMHRCNKDKDSYDILPDAEHTETREYHPPHRFIIARPQQSERQAPFCSSSQFPMYTHGLPALF